MTCEISSKTNFKKNSDKDNSVKNNNHGKDDDLTQLA